MNPRSRMLALVASATLLLVPACGGDDGGDASEATTAVTRPTPTPTTAVPGSPSTTPDTSAAHSPIPIVFDTDLASDDIVALSYLSSRSDVELLAVTVTGTGEVRCPRGADVARGLLARMGRGDVPVACGRSTPLSGNREFPEPWRDAADNAYGLLLEMVTPPTDQPDATELLVETITQSSEPVVLLTLGPLTNVAEAFAARPEIAGGINRIVTMGGAVTVPGNVIPDGASEPNSVEWNLYVDPTAAADVVDSGVPMTLVALDATNQVPLDDELIKRLEANNTTDAVDRVLRIFDVFPPPYLWDTLAAIAVTDPFLVPTHAATIAVETDGAEAGRTVVKSDGAAVDVAEVPDPGAVIDQLLRTLAGVPEGGELAVPTTLPLLGEMTVGFDGTTCTYDGPTTVTEGAYTVSATAGAVEYLVAIAHLVDGATVDDVLEWVAAHPDEEPPMVDEVAVVGGWGEPSPARIDVHAGTVAIACGTEDGAIHIAVGLEVSE